MYCVKMLFAYNLMKMEANIYYKEKDFRLYNGDCLDVLKTFPENTFNMVFADPPCIRPFCW